MSLHRFNNIVIFIHQEFKQRGLKGPRRSQRTTRRSSTVHTENLNSPHGEPQGSTRWTSRNRKESQEPTRGSQRAHRERPPDTLRLVGLSSLSKRLLPKMMIQDKSFFYLQLKRVLDLYHLQVPEHLLKALRHSALVELMAHINKPVIFILLWQLSLFSLLL